MLAEIIFYLLAAGAVFAAGYVYSECFGYANKNAESWKNHSDVYFNKYMKLLNVESETVKKSMDALAERDRQWMNVLFKAKDNADELLRDAVELERYLRDEERDQAKAAEDNLEDIADFWIAAYVNLAAAVNKDGATLKNIRSRLDKDLL